MTFLVPSLLQRSLRRRENVSIVAPLKEKDEAEPKVMATPSVPAHCKRRSSEREAPLSTPPPPYDTALPTLDRRGMGQGIQLVSIAADAYEDGDTSRAVDIYRMGVDKILTAMPDLSHADTKGLRHCPSAPTSLRCETPNEHDTRSFTPTHGSYPSRLDPLHRFKAMSQRVIHAAVQGAVMVKQSPIPDAIRFVLMCVMQVFCWIDHRYHVVQQLQDLSMAGVKKLLDADEEYHLHEYVSEALHTLATATLRAIVAFQETPRSPITVPS